MDDRDLLLMWRNDMEAERLVYSVPPAEVTMQEHEVWLSNWICKMWRKESRDSKMTEGLFLAINSETQETIGTGRITANFNSRLSSMCLIHYTVAPTCRKQGYGAKVVRALVDKAKDEMGYSTIGAKIHRENTASLKCALTGGVNAVEFL